MKQLILLLLVFLSINVQGQDYRQVIHYVDACDTNTFSVSFEGTGQIWIKKQPKLPGQYVVKDCHPPYNIVMRFQVNTNGEICGDMTKYSWYGKNRKATSSINNGQCK
jgi:hypothetical protein